jgi:hypothetical protein
MQEGSHLKGRIYCLLVLRIVAAGQQCRALGVPHNLRRVVPTGAGQAQPAMRLQTK